MPRYVVIHPVAFEEGQLQPLSREPLPDGVCWDSSLVSFVDGRTFCLWQAPATDALIDIFKKYAVPYETIHVVRRFDPTTGVLEPEVLEKVMQPA
jgi:hypothetical protein